MYPTLNITYVIIVTKVYLRIIIRYDICGRETILQVKTIYMHIHTFSLLYVNKYTFIMTFMITIRNIL